MGMWKCKRKREMGRQRRERAKREAQRGVWGFEGKKSRPGSLPG